MSEGEGKGEGEGDGRGHLCALKHIEVTVGLAALIKVVVLLLLVLILHARPHPAVLLLEPLPLLPLLVHRSPAVPPSLQRLHLRGGRALCVSVARRQCSLALALRATLGRALGRLAFCRALGRTIGRTLGRTLRSTLRRRLNSLTVCGRRRFGLTVGGCGLCRWLSLCNRWCLTLCSQCCLTLCSRCCLTLCSWRCLTLRGCLSYGIIRRSLRSWCLRSWRLRSWCLTVGRDLSGDLGFTFRHACLAHARVALARWWGKHNRLSEAGDDYSDGTLMSLRIAPPGSIGHSASRGSRTGTPAGEGPLPFTAPLTGLVNLYLGTDTARF